MEYRSLKNDFYYDSADEVLEYSLFNGVGEMIFLGKSFRNPKTGLNRINICQKIKDWLNLTLPQGWDTVDAVYKHPEAYTDFTLYDHTTQQPLEVYYVLYDWSTDFDGSNMILSNPVNSKLDPRMRLFWTRFSLSADTVELERGYPHFVFNFTGSTDFDFSAQTRSYPFTSTDNTAFTMSTEEDWIRVYKYSNSFVLDIAENSGSTAREGSFCITYVGVNFEPFTQCYKVTQAREHLEIVFGNTEFSYQAGWRTIPYTANTNVEIISALPDWILGVQVSSNPEIALNLAENSGVTYRTATLEVRRIDCPFGEVKTVEITQRDIQFQMGFWDNDPLTYQAGAARIQFSSNTYPEVVSASPWITSVVTGLSSNIGRITGVIDITYDENEGNLRSGDITFQRRDHLFDDTATLTVTQKSFDYGQLCFTVRAHSDGEIQILSDKYGAPDYMNDSIVYRDEGTEQWTNYTPHTGDSGSKIITISSGQCIQFMGQLNSEATQHSFNCSCAGGYDIYGNIMSLIDREYYLQGNSVPSDRLNSFFEEQDYLISAENLVMPATDLGVECYANMFKNCVNLKKGPAELPGGGTKAHYRMFYGCTSLQKAPELTAPIMSEQCYADMFTNCSSLSSITCLAAVSALSMTTSWTYGVASAGTFVKREDTSFWESGVNGIPAGWTVVEEPWPSHNYEDSYLTIECIRGTTLKFQSDNSDYGYTTLMYQKNDDTGWTTVRSSQVKVISLSEGDIVKWKGTNNSTSAFYMYPASFRGTGYFNVWGNINSLLYGDDFKNKPIKQTEWTFVSLFTGINVVSAKHLILPEDTYSRCYTNMFKDLKVLQGAPLLPASSLTSNCYSGMFSGCTSLGHIKCLATNPNTNYSGDWLAGTMATGIFTKKAGVTWPTGASGIPDDWVVEETAS